jgi:broad specificity phosphatase PhoE
MKATDACTVYLIRHGETDWNRNGRWQGQTDVPLNAAGLAQAEILARRLAARRFDSLYSSDLQRAAQTAEIVGRAIGLRAALTPALREIDLGRWSGHTRMEIAQLFPEDWRRLETDEDIARGGGETFAAFQGRLTAWLDGAARREAGRSLCAVTHGGCIRAVLLHACGLGWADRRQIPPIENTAVAVLHTDGAGWKFDRVDAGVGPIDGERTAWPGATVDEGEII